jgi:hypothetical protein
VSLNSMLAEVRKLRAVRAVGLPPGLFADVAPKVLFASGVPDSGSACPGDGAGVVGYGDGMGCMGSPTAA